MPQRPSDADDYSEAMRRKAISAALSPPPDDPTLFRADGSRKGPGFLGTLTRPDGAVSTELSVGVNIDGKEVEIPTLVPTLTPEERQWLLVHDGDPKAIPASIIDKAVAHAQQRMRAGKSVFAEPQ